MTPPASARPLVAIAALAAVAVLAAFWWSGQLGSAPEPGDRRSHPEQRDLAAPAAASPTAEGRRDVDAMTEPPDDGGTVANDGHRIAVRTVDGSGAAVPWIAVALGSGRQLLEGTTDDRGELEFVDTRGLGDEALPCTAKLLGRVVQATVPPFRGAPRRVDIAVGDTGTLAVRALGDCPDARVQVQAQNGVGGGSQEAVGGAPWRLTVATGTAFRLIPQGCNVHLPQEVTGPQVPGQVVDVDVDFRLCEVTGRLLPSPNEVRAIVVTAAGLVSVPTGIRKDGSFYVALPRQTAPARLYLVDGERAGICSRLQLDADTCDTGTVALVARPVLGTITTPTSGRAEPVGFDFNGIGALPVGFQTGPLIARKALGPGLEQWLGLPGLDAVTVTAAGRGFVAEPPRAELRPGGHVAFEFIAAGTVEVLLDAGDAQGLVGIWLQPAAGGDRVFARRGLPGAGGQQFRFEDLRPGTYAVETPVGRPVGGTVVVTSGSSQQLRLVLPR